MQKYNGWSNRDTWLVMLWLENDYNNYMYMKHLKNGMGIKNKLEKLTCCELMDRIRRCHFGDRIDWHNVNMEEIREALLEEI